MEPAALTPVPAELATPHAPRPVPSTNPAAIHLAAQSARARPGVLSSLRTATRLLSGGALEDPLAVDWSQLRYQHLAALLAVLTNEERKAAGIAHIRNCVLGVMREAWRLELIGDGQWLRLKDVPVPRGSSLPAGREVRSGELDALMKICAMDSSNAGRRDKALLAVLFGGGLRRNEVALLALADYEPDPGRLRVSGKGRRERYVPLAAGVAQCLGDWLEVRGDTPGALFVPINKAGVLDIRHLTSQALYNACLKRAREAGVAHFAPHDARRTLASNALDNSGDIVAVSGLLGHSSPAVTAKYDRRGERAKERLAARLHVPYYPQEEGEAGR